MTQYTDTLANMQEYKANGFTEAQAAILAKTLENTIKNAATSTELSFVKTEKKIKDVKEENKEIKSVLGEISKTLVRLESKLDSSIERLESKLDNNIERLESKLDSNIERLESKLDLNTAELRSEIGELKNEMSMMRNNFKFYAFAIVISILFFDKAYPSILNYILSITSK